MPEDEPTIEQWRVAGAQPRPSHPSLAAFLLVLGTTLVLLGLAAVSTFGLG